MVRTSLRYGAGLIALYLLVSYTTNSGQLINSSSAGAVNLVKAFQGR
jgi:hypothetical protein